MNFSNYDALLDHRRGAEMKVQYYNTTKINKRKIGKYISIEITNYLSYRNW